MTQPEAVCDEMTSLSPGEKLAIALDMHEFGVSVMRQNIRRREPELSDREVAERLRVWLQDHPLGPVDLRHARAYLPLSTDAVVAGRER